MKTFKNQSRQGDVLISRINELPDNAIPQSKKGNDWTIAHSETGHHHVVSNNGVNFYESANDPLQAYLVVENKVELRHLKEFDKHETQAIPKGIYSLRRQRQQSIEGWERVAD